MNQAQPKRQFVYTRRRIAASGATLVARLTLIVIVIALLAASLPTSSAWAESTALTDGLFRTYAVVGLSLIHI